MTWKSKYIWWHEVTFVDKKRYKNNKVGNVLGLQERESSWKTFDEVTKDVTPYIKFKFLGKTSYTGDSKEDMKTFKKFQKEQRIKEVNKQ